jgi:anti-anti-sigma regulatory factor
VTKKKTARAPQNGRIELAAELTIAHAADLQRSFKEGLAGGAALLVDGTRVTQIDTSILQLLLAAWRTSAQRGISCSWVGASEALRRSASLIGVAEALQL